MKLSELIPNPERLRARAVRKEDPQPTKANLRNMAASLLDLGYSKINPEVFGVICSYGALLMDGTAERGLFLKGECGIGKSYGVECLGYLFNFPVLKPEDFAADFKNCNGNLGELEKNVTNGYDFYEKPHTVIIDEIGSQDTVRNFGETSDIMATVLDMRYRAYLKYGVLTIVTTNLTDRDITARYGLRIEDRIAEMFYVRRVTGISLRKNPVKPSK